MFLFYHLFRRYVPSTPSSSTLSESSISSSDPAKDRAILTWWATFAFSLFFRPVVELVIRLLFFSVCILLIGTLDGSFNLVVGHAVLKAAKYKGYEPPLSSSLKAGSLGGLIVIPPATLVTTSLIALLGGVHFQNALSRHITFFLELASAITVSTAAGSLGVTVVRRTHLDIGPTLDAPHAARAGALGACMLTVPIMLTAVVLVHEVQKMPSARTDPSTLPPDLVESFGCPESPGPSTPRSRTRPPRVLAHTAAETAAYVVVMLCFLTVRLLCF